MVVGDEASFSIDKDVSGVLLQYPATDGSIHDYKVTHCPPAYIDRGDRRFPTASKHLMLSSLCNCWCYHTCAKVKMTIVMTDQNKHVLDNMTPCT